MEIGRHLSGDELAGLVTEAKVADKNRRPIEDFASEHLAKCESCRQEYEGLQRTLDVLPEAMRSATDFPHYFWLRQQAAIRSRIAVEEASRRSWRGFVWATVAALVLLAGLLLNSTKTPPTTQVEIQPDPDQQLLVAVEQAVYSGVPESLAPAALLAEDISSAVEPSASRNSKEKRNEN
jgi:predicted anti-sigma-YlaC factor YlaD